MSITDIEKQIAKVSAALTQARVDQYAIAEQSLLTAQKAAATAKAKVNELLRKAGITVAAQQRLALANAALADKELNLANAEAALAILKSDKEAAQLFAKNVKRVMAGKKLGKKIKFTKKEKAVLSAEKKSAKKITKAEKKAKKQKHVIAIKMNDESLASTPTEPLIADNAPEKLNTLETSLKGEAPLIDITTANSATHSSVEVPAVGVATEDQSTSIEAALKL